MVDDPAIVRGAGAEHVLLARRSHGILSGLGAAARVILRNPVLPLLIVALPAFALFVPGYATPQNVSNLALSSAVLLLLVGGGAFVLISGNFDLSTEGTLAFTAVVGGWLMTTQAPGSGWGLAPPLTIAVMIAIGVLIGIANGLLVELLRVNPFIVTLGMLLTLKGAAAIPTQAQTIYGLPPGFNWVGRASFLGISAIVVVAVVVYALLGLYLKYSQCGRHLYAIGGNKEAARENGISAVKVVVAAYAISGGLAGLAAWLDAARLDSTGPVLGDGIIRLVAE